MLSKPDARLRSITTLSRGTRWSDKAACVCPLIGGFLRVWNDALPDHERDDLLLPLVPHLVGSAGWYGFAEVRALLCVDWLVRTQTPAWLRAAALVEAADRIAGQPDVTVWDVRSWLWPEIESRHLPECSLPEAVRALRVTAAEATYAALWLYHWDKRRLLPVSDAYHACKTAAWAAVDSGADLTSTVESLKASAYDLVVRMFATRGRLLAGRPRCSWGARGGSPGTAAVCGGGSNGHSGSGCTRTANGRRRRTAEAAE